MLATLRWRLQKALQSHLRGYEQEQDYPETLQT